MVVENTKEMKINKTINKIKYRHKRGLILSFCFECFVRFYKRRFFRFFLNKVFPNKEPMGWFFVTGCYNAGTTIVKNAIGIHPDVSMAPVEGDILTSHMPQFEAGGYQRAMYGNSMAIQLHRENNQLNKKAINRDWSPWISTEKFYCEKSISQSVRIKLLRKYFLNSKFICVTRNPDDVISGIQRRSKPSGFAKLILGSKSYPSRFLAKQWGYLYGLVLSDYKEEDTMFCSYEKFIYDPANATIQLYAFLGLRSVEVSTTGSVLVVDSKELAIRPHVTEQNGGCDSYDSVKCIVDNINQADGVL